MKTNKKIRVWDFIGNNIFALSTIVAGVGVISWQSFGNTANFDAVSSAILGLLCLLATSEIIEGRKRLDNIHEDMEIGFSRILSKLPEVEVKRFPDSRTAIEYLCERVSCATVSVDQTSLDKRRSQDIKLHDKFRRVKDDIIKYDKKDIRYRYLFRATERRIEAVKTWLEPSNKGRFFTAGYKASEDSFPLMMFFIFDEEEVYVRNPYGYGEEEVYLSIRHPDIVALFSHCFNHLWRNADRCFEHNKNDEKQKQLYEYEQQIKELDLLLRSDE